MVSRIDYIIAQLRLLSKMSKVSRETLKEYVFIIELIEGMNDDAFSRTDNIYQVYGYKNRHRVIMSMNMSYLEARLARLEEESKQIIKAKALVEVLWAKHVAA